MFKKTFNMIAKRSLKQGGYTLAELSISTSIIAMLAVGGLSIMGKKNESDRAKQTLEKIEVIENALKGFVRSNKYVPCPAVANVLESNTNFGKSVAYNATTHICDGSSLANSTGAVPVRTLNLDDNYTYDGWGRKFAFRTSDYSGSKLDFDSIDFHGDIAVVDTKGINKTDINELPPNNNGAIYLIISYGSNGKDVAYRKNDTTTPPSQATGMERSNTDHTSKIYVQSPKSATFDDIVAYGMKKRILPPRSIASPLQIDALACENAGAIMKNSRSALNTFATDSNGSTARADLIYKNAKKIYALCQNAPTSQFIPANITNLRLWLDANDNLSLYGTTVVANGSSDCTTGAAPANNSYIGCWKDKSGLGYDAKNTSTSANRPIYTTAVLNNKAMLNFSGTANSLLKSTIPSPYITSSITYMIVAKRTAGVANASSFNALGSGQTGDASNTTSFTGFYEGASPWPLIRGYRDTTAQSYMTNPGSAAYIGAGIYNGTNFTMYINGTSGTPTTSGATGNFNIAEFHIGDRVDVPGGNSKWNGYIGEIIVYDRALNDTERAGIENYLSNKWAITLTSTAINTCPTGMTFQKSAARPEGSCQCPSGKVFYQELNNTSACLYGNSVVFNSCIDDPTTSTITYSPAPTNSGLSLWLDANDCATVKLAAGSKVKMWMDKSPVMNAATGGGSVPTGNNVSQEVDSKRPAYTEATLNSKPVIRFDGTTDFMASVANPGQAPGNDSTVIAVAGITTNPLSGTNPTVASFGSNTGSLGWMLFYNSSSSYSITMQARRTGVWGSDIAIHNTTPSTTTTRYYVMSGWTSGTTTRVYVNGQIVTGATSAGGNLNYGSSPKFEIGSSAGGQNLFKGDIAEVLVYNRVLSNTERVAIEGEYLANKWGLFMDPINRYGNISTPELWLDASDTDTVFATSCSSGKANEGNAVVCWTDKVTGTTRAVTASGVNMPKYTLGRILGKPAIVFDGVNDYLTHATLPSFSSGSMTGVTIFAVFQNAVETPTAKEAIYSVGSATNMYSFAISAAGAFGINDTSASTTYKGRLVSTLVPTPQLMTAPHIYAAQFTPSNTGAGHRIWVDGVEPGTYNPNSTLTSHAFGNGINIGALNAAASPFHGDIGEIIVYNTPSASSYMSDIDRKEVEQYLSSKWGIAVTP